MQTRHRTLTWLILAVVALATAGTGWLIGNRRAARDWNVIIITLDTTRADHLGCYGATDVLTPTIDELAARGVLFERAIAPAPLTLTSHSTMLTGLHPPEHGLVTNGKGRLPDEIETFAEILRKQGYRTAAFIAAFVLDSRFGLSQGFETYDDDLSGAARTHDVLHRERRGDIVVDAALNWMTGHKASKFHCWIHLYDPHFPYQAHDEQFGDQFQDRPYDGELAFVDQQLARITTFLRSEQLEENTFVVIVGDHGEGLGEHREPTHGYQLYQSTLHVPLILIPPLKEAAGTRVTEAVPLVDLMPTMLDLLGLPTPKAISGLSLARIWQGQPSVARDCFSMTDEPYLDNGWSPLRSLTTNRWKYIRTPKTELYDLTADPQELANLVESRADLVSELDQRLTTLEDRFRLRKVDEAEMSAKDRRTLASLGYTGGASNRSAASSASDIDVKEMMPVYNQLSEAIELLEEGRIEAAEAPLREIVQSHPRYVKALGNLGICLARQQKWDEAITCYQQVLEIDPDETSALMNLAAAHAVHERIDEAIRYYRLAQSSDPKSAAPAFQLGQLAADTGNWSQALEFYAKAVRLDPQFDEAHRAWGDLLVEIGDPAGAIKHYELAMEINPVSLPAIVNRGILAARQGETDSAETYFRRALQHAPDNLLCRRNLGLIHEQRGKTGEAIDEFTAILEQAPDHFPTLLSLGWIRASHRDPQWRDGPQAVEMAQRVCAEFNPPSIEGLDLLAAAYAETGKFADAVKTINDAIDKLAAGQNGLRDELKSRRELYQQQKPYRRP